MTKTKNVPAEQKGRKRVSKKNKIAWRKHCSTKDVDSYLDEVRHEERVGVNFSAVENDKLFYIDTTSVVPGEEKIKSKAERKLEAKKKLEGVPRCFEALLPHTAVPDPVKKRNRVRTPEERKHPIKKKIEAYRKAHNILTAKERCAANNVIVNRIRKENALISEHFARDLWAEVPPENPEVDLQWLNPTTHRHILKNTGQIKKKVPETVRNKPSILPAIEAPHPGSSYNPSYVDHRALLTDISEKEKTLIKEEKHINRVTSEMFSAVSEAQNHSSWIKEMSQGLPQSKDAKVKDDDDDGKVYKAVNAPTKDKKKTRKTRKNLRLAKKELNQRKLKAIEKKKVADIYKLKKIVQNVEKAELKSVENKARMQKKKELKEFEAKRLSKLKFEENEEDFNMPCDLSGNLVGLKPEGNLLRDRFKSLQKRNIIQPTAFQRHRKKGNKKAFTKSSHKQDQQ